MSNLTPEQEARMLSTSQKADIRKGLRAALTQSHISLAKTCDSYEQKYGISYSALRVLMDGKLPDYLADVPLQPRKKQSHAKAVAPRHNLTSEETSALLAAYRDTYATQDQKALKRLLIEYQSKYKVARGAIDRAVALDQSRHRAEYRALRKMHQQAQEARRRDEAAKTQAADLKPPDYYARATYCPVCYRDFDANFIPPHGAGPHGCRGAGKFAATLYTIEMERRESRRNRKAAAKQSKKGKQPRGGGSVWTTSGGLPGLGRRR